MKGVLKASTYVEFKKLLSESACGLCPLSKGRTHIVVDRGNPAADMLFIGEAPGETEDLEGRAFVGRSGRLLDRCLAEAGINPERDALIVNVVKCRPPDNRRPLPSEVEACAPFLKKQIELVRPRVVVLLGATALRHAAPGRKAFSMKEEAGKFFFLPDLPGVRFIVFYHPAYILRDPRKLPLMQDHVRKLKEHLHGQKKPA